MYIVPQFNADEILIYLRKSRADDPLLTVEEVLENHERRIFSWLEVNQPDAGRIPSENILREVVSGETIESRPRMQELLRRIEAPKIKAIIVTEPSRLSRGSLREIGYLVDVLRYTNTIVVTLDRGAYDLNEDRDRKDFERELMGSNDYLEYQKRIMGAGKLTAVTQFGSFIGSRAPYGYKKAVTYQGKKKLHTLEPIPEQAEVVKRVFEMYRDGIGTIRIADILTQEHIPSPSGRKQWSHVSVNNILNNEHYLGKLIWLRNKQTRTVEDGKIVTKRPKYDKKIITDGLHPAIISQELWDAAHETRGKKPRLPKSQELVNPLAGLIFCKSCGYSIVAQMHKDLQGRQKASPAFRCSFRRKGCDCGSVAQAPVFAAVERELEEAIENIEVEIKSGTDNGLEQHRKKVEQLEKRLKALYETEAKQWAEKMENGMPEHVFKRLNEATVAEIEEVQQALYEARESTPEEVDLEERVATFRDALAALRDPDAPVKEQNRLLKTCIERIDYYRARADKQGGKHYNDNRPMTLEFTLRV